MLTVLHGTIDTNKQPLFVGEYKPCPEVTAQFIKQFYLCDLNGKSTSEALNMYKCMN